MSFTYIAKMPTPEEIKERFPVSDELAKIKAKRDAKINDIIAGRDNRFLMIVPLNFGRANRCLWMK